MSAESLMARHARSFAPATRLLARSDRSRVARLYAICRTIDDIADDIGGPIGHQRLQNLYADLTNFDTNNPLAKEARLLFKERPEGLTALADLVATAAADTGRTCINDDAQLEVYCMGVAGTVGVMICTLFNIDKKWHASAADLGKAMQLTNICRDVAEDAVIGRRYLPFNHCPFTPEEILAGGGEAIDAASQAMALLLDRADDLYLSGRAGFVALPWRLRLAVAAASAMYAGIGSELRFRNYTPLNGRAVVSNLRKTGLALKAVRQEGTLILKSNHASSHVRT
jgi:phytoene synthase